VKDRETTSLVAAMRTLADDAGVRAEMGDASYKYACEKFAVETVNQTLLAHLGL
jgi:glycosyltransferase involved in cell wall biosynthesis